MQILTFDIEDWFHIEFEDNIDVWDTYESRLNSNIEIIFDLLKKHNQSATFFCLGWVAKRYPEIIKKIDKLGYEIGSHSFDHKLILQKDKKKFEEDLKLSLYTIEDIIGKKVKYFRAPAFSVNKDTLWFFEILEKYGIEIDSSIFPAKRDYGGFPEFAPARPVIIAYNNTRIKEFPINTANILGAKIIFSGGGYFRFFPYPIIKYLSQRSEYLMTYFHPRDFDKDQPVLKKLSFPRKFKSYVGLSYNLSKMNKLLSEFDFIDLSQADDKIDWNTVDVVHIKYR